jgi:hypothetical protein
VPEVPGEAETTPTSAEKEGDDPKAAVDTPPGSETDPEGAGAPDVAASDDADASDDETNKGGEA